MNDKIEILGNHIDILKGKLPKICLILIMKI